MRQVCAAFQAARGITLSGNGIQKERRMGLIFSKLAPLRGLAG
jgi:hypothetical protein